MSKSDELPDPWTHAPHEFLAYREGDRIENVDGVVRRVGDIHPAELAMDGGVIEAALPAMLGKLDEALEAKPHPVQPALT